MAKKKVVVEEKKNVKKESTKVVEKDNKGISQINRFNILFVDLQAIFTIITIIFLIWYIFDAGMWHALQISLGLNMLIIGYNQKIVYNKPKISWVYYITGVILIICDILMLLGIGV